MRNSVNHIFLIIFVLGINIDFLNAQSLTMYHMPAVPQSYYLNPATQPNCRIHIGMPIASSFYFKAYSSAFNLNDIFYYGPEGDSLRHPLSSEADKQKFLNNFKDQNTLLVETAFNLASIGFKVDDWHFALDITARLTEQLNYPKDLMVFLLHGNISQPDFDFSNLKIQSHNFTELGVNVSRKISQELTVGARPKLLFGIASITTGNSELTLETDPLNSRINANYELRANIPGMRIPVDEDGIFDPNGEMKFDSTISSFSDYRKLATTNFGLGIDLGAHYKPIDQIEISLSILDLGYIKWKDYNHTISFNGTYDYQGIEWALDDTLDFGESMWDTIKAHLQISGSDESFKTTLYPKIYLGGRYFITDDIDVGLLSKTEFIKGTIKEDISLLANLRPTPYFNLSASYNLLSDQYNSFGLGLSFIIGPFNFYIVSDNISTSYQKLKQIPVPLPYDLSTYSVRFGFNLVFGCNPYKIKDKPMVYKLDDLE